MCDLGSPQAGDGNGQQHHTRGGQPRLCHCNARVLVRFRWRFVIQRLLSNDSANGYSFASPVSGQSVFETFLRLSANSGSLYSKLEVFAYELQSVQPAFAFFWGNHRTAKVPRPVLSVRSMRLHPD